MGMLSLIMTLSAILEVIIRTSSAIYIIVSSTLLHRSSVQRCGPASYPWPASGEETWGDRTMYL